MRVWDISPGYLSQRDLRAEHRHVHVLWTSLERGDAPNHPEAERWANARGALTQRHAQLAAEWRLRGRGERTPLPRAAPRWPATYLTDPATQFTTLRGRYVGNDGGRIPLPRNAQALWAQHKYSVMARDPAMYRRYGQAVTRLRAQAAPPDLVLALVEILRITPPRGRLINALEHMWGHVNRVADADDQRSIQLSTLAWLTRIQVLARRHREPYLLSSTALGELAVYVTDA